MVKNGHELMMANNSMSFSIVKAKPHHLKRNSIYYATKYIKVIKNKNKNVLNELN